MTYIHLSDNIFLSFTLKMTYSDENVRVLVRVRPLTSEESVNDSTSIEVAPDKQTLFLVLRPKKHCF